MPWLIGILITALVAGALLLGLGFALAAYAARTNRQTIPQAWAWQRAHYDLSWYEGLSKTEWQVTCSDGYVLHVHLLENPIPSDRYILISHGYTDCHVGSLKYAKTYLDLGFNVITYDLRGHGENAPAFCTYSVREARDLNALILDCRGRFPGARVLGLHGESLGAATTVACLGYRPEVDFAVADCGFCEIEPILVQGLKGFHLPAWLVHVASLCAKIRYGSFYHEMRPIDCLPENRIPILFLHGEKDSFIPPEHSHRMWKATSGFSEFFLIEGAGHAASVLTDPAAYRAYVEGFLRKVLI